MRRKKDKSNGITALYERLSRDDDNAGESNSIVHQKQMLEDYAMKHGFTNLVHFTDDGWSGATFDRPSWNRLVEGVKNGEITACICKDMSRIGRDHLQVGFFTDILFREKEVRFIAINNGIDSDRQETSEFAPFLNIMNEWFVRDTSKKIKAVLKSRGSSGNAHTSNIPPYGYLKDPENPDHWIIDLEHFGINREGKLPWLSAVEEEKYQEGMAWKRQVHKKNGTKLLETYSYLSSEGRLLEYLDSLLKKNGVKYKEPDFTDIFESVYEKQSDRYFSEFIKLCATFVALFKSQGHKIDDLGSLQDNGVSSQKPFFRKRNAAFKMIVRPLMEAYDAFLREKGAVDFADMINLAAENVTAGQKVHPYRYVIIDEYQDISYARYRLVKAILDQTGANLLCVGDDWQSIYRFAGSDISLFTDFERYFGRSVIMRLERTYRNSQQLIDEAGRFVLRNPYQLKKSLVSPKSLDYPISFFCYDIAPFQMLRKAIDKIISEFGKDSSILILGRNKFDFEILIGSQLFQWHRDGTLMYWDSPETPIRFLTAHKSKGLEADNVILLNFQNSTLGFPNKIADDPVLALVLAEPEDFLYAEERRLLYVALTRTKNRVFVLTDSRKPSEFFKEFKPSKSVFILNKETDIADLPCCPKCRTGHLLSRRNERTGKFFVGCSNYPKCDYVVRDVTVLTEQKVCPQCGGFLVRRRGQYGEFYGCTNYPRCSYTEQISVEKKTGN